MDSQTFVISSPQMAIEQCNSPLYIFWKLGMENKQYGINSLVVS